MVSFFSLFSSYSPSLLDRTSSRDRHAEISASAAQAASIAPRTTQVERDNLVEPVVVSLGIINLISNNRQHKHPIWVTSNIPSLARRTLWIPRLTELRQCPARKICAGTATAVLPIVFVTTTATMLNIPATFRKLHSPQSASRPKRARRLHFTIPIRASHSSLRLGGGPWVSFWRSPGRMDGQGKQNFGTCLSKYIFMIDKWYILFYSTTGNYLRFPGDSRYVQISYMYLTVIP